MDANGPLNRTLAEGVHRRMASESFHHASRGVFWRFLGYGAGGGLAALGIGAGCYMAFVGYSYITDNTAAADRLAAAIKTAMETTTLKAEGTVGVREDAEIGLKEGSEVGLKDGQTVSIDNPVVQLDPKAQVKVSGKLELPQVPTQPNQKAENGEAVRTSFTVFKSVPFEGGQVDTGWKYQSNRDQKPYEQYCYWTKGGPGGIDVKVNLGQNKRPLNGAGDTEVIDRQAAFRLCQWN